MSMTTTTKTETLEQSIARRDYAAHSPHDAVRYVDEQVAAAAAAATAKAGKGVQTKGSKIRTRMS